MQLGLGRIRVNVGCVSRLALLLPTSRGEDLLARVVHFYFVSHGCGVRLRDKVSSGSTDQIWSHYHRPLRIYHVLYVLMCYSLLHGAVGRGYLLALGTLLRTTSDHRLRIFKAFYVSKFLDFLRLRRLAAAHIYDYVVLVEFNKWSLF